MRWIRLALGLAILVPTGARAEVVDDEPPGIIHLPIFEAPAGQAVEITAKITDKSGVFEPTMFYRVVGTAKFTSSGMSGKQDVYVATIPASVLISDVEYFIEAYDTLGNGPARFASADSPQRVTVLAAATKVAATEVTPAKPAVPATAALDVAGAQPSTTWMKLGTFGLMGVGAIAGAVGAVLGLSATSQYDKAKADPSTRGANNLFTGAKSKGTAANLSFVAAGVLASTGAVLLVQSRPESAEPSISMTVSPAGFGIAAKGSF